MTGLIPTLGMEQLFHTRARPDTRPALTARRGRASFFSVFSRRLVWFFPSGFLSSRAHASRAVEELLFLPARRRLRGFWCRRGRTRR